MRVAVDIREGVDMDLFVLVSVLPLLLLAMVFVSEVPRQQHADADNSDGRQRYDNSCNEAVV